MNLFRINWRGETGWVVKAVALCGWMAFGWASLQAQPAVTAFTVKQDGSAVGPFHVVVGEAGVRGSVEVAATFKNIPADVAYRAFLSLIGPEGEESVTVLSHNTIEAGGNYVISNGSGSAGSLISPILNFAIEPDVALPLGAYSVRMRVQRWDGSKWVNESSLSPTSAAVRYYVFPDGSDAQRNIKLEVSSILVTRPWMVESTAADSFRASVTVDAYRYDEGSVNPATFTPRVSGALVDTHGTRVPVVLSTNGTDFSGAVDLVGGSVAANGGGSPATYASASLSKTLYYRSTGSLDYLAGDLTLDLSVEHDDASTGGPTVVSGVGDTVAKLHARLTGRVIFGDVVTTVSAVSLVNLPASFGTPATVDLVTADGVVNEGPGHAYAGASIRVQVDANGDASFDPSGSTSSVTLVAPASPDAATMANVEYIRGPVVLDETGAETSSLTVRLPIGLGWMAATDSLMLNAWIRSSLARGLTLLDAALQPESATVMLGATGGVSEFYLIEESKPFRWGMKEVSWNPSNGRFDFVAGSSGAVTPEVATVHGEHWDALEAVATSYSKPAWARRASNRALYRSVRPALISGVPELQVKIATAANGEAVITEALLEAFPANPAMQDVYLHFPQGTRVAWKSPGMAQVSIRDDKLSGPVSGVDRIEVPYNRSILNACYSFGLTSVILIPGAGDMALTPDGGLHADTLQFAAGPFDLEWGSVQVSGLTEPVHTTMGWLNAAAAFASAGISLVEDPAGWNYDHFADPASSAVGILSHSGVKGSGTLVAQRPAATDYSAGTGDYAGLNLRETLNGSPVEGFSHIGGERIPKSGGGNYTLKSNAKYYVRLGGVSGVHDVNAASFAGSEIPIYGYNIQFQYFGLAYLSNLNAGPDPITGEDFQLGSTVSGRLEFTSGPLDTFKILFSEMSVTGDGQLGEATPTTTGVQPLQYWAGGVKVQSVAFATQGGCANEALLTVGVEGYADAIDSPLHGTLGIASAVVPLAPVSGHSYGAGHLVSLKDAEPFGLRPRLRLPSRIHVRGPLISDGEYESYTLTPSSDAYYSLYDGAIAEGFLAFPALMDVSFFEDLEVHVRTGAASSASLASANLAKIRLSGGWSSGGQTFWTDPDFDDMHVGFAGGDLDAYWENNHEIPAYEVVARQQLFGIIPLDYVVEWDSTMRKFGAVPKEFDILVLNAKNKLEYLSAARTNISFGIKAEVDGIPDINLGAIAFNAVDEATGALESISQAAQNEIAKYLDKGMGYADELIADAPDAMFERMWELTLEPVIGDGVVNAHVSLPSFLVELRAFLEVQAEATFEADLLAFLEDRFGFDLSDSKDDLVEVIAQVMAVNALISSEVDAVGGMVGQVEARLMQLQNSIRSITSVAVKIPDISGLDTDLEATYRWKDTEVPWNDLKNWAVAQPQVQEATYELIRGFLPPTSNGAEDFAADTICRILASLVLQAAEEMNIPSSIIPAGSIDGLSLEFAPDFLNNFGPILQEVRSSLLAVDDVITQLLEGVATSKKLLDEIQQYLDLVDAYGTAAQAMLEDAYKKIEDALQVSLAAKIKLWYELDLGYFETPEFEAEFNLFLKQELKDAFMESEIVVGIQTALRQHVQDIKAEIENRIDVVFAQVEAAVKAELTGLVGKLDLGTIDTSFLSPFDEIAGYGALDGFLRVNGDRAELLRMDAKFELKAPEAMKFQGFLEIKALDLLGLGGCDYGGEEATEVTLGAIKVPFDWLGGGVKMDVFTSFSFDGSGPRGFGGGFDMVEGTLNFETFEIYELGAAAAFGADENYLAAKAGMQLKDYAVAGGVFFGKSCTIDPVAIAHEETAEFLYNESGGSFTGALVYGFCKIPISEALGIPSSCMFRISAGMGAGAFYFVEGPTFGGIMDAEVSGEALCVVSIKGEVGLIGAKVGNDLRFQGKGKLSGKAGACPFCVKFGKQVKIEYVNSKWKVKI